MRLLRNGKLNNNIICVAASLFRQLGVANCILYINRIAILYPLKGNIGIFVSIFDAYNIVSLPVCITYDRLVNVNLKVILYLKENGDSFFSILISATKEKILYFVPHLGYIENDRETFMTKWEGVSIIINRTDDFENNPRNFSDLKNSILNYAAISFLLPILNHSLLNRMSFFQNKELRGKLLREWILNAEEHITIEKELDIVTLINSGNLEIKLFLRPYDKRSGELFNAILNYISTHSNCRLDIGFTGSEFDSLYCQFVRFINSCNIISNVELLTNSLSWWFLQKNKDFDKFAELIYKETGITDHEIYEPTIELPIREDTTVLPKIMINNVVVPDSLRAEEVIECLNILSFKIH